jgi:LuxR family maltose regulon positive regulatory protein
VVTTERRSLRPLQFAPTEAKFRPSVRTEGLVLRGSLVDRLSDAESGGVVLVTAPPGYGKTVLASQWAGEDPRPFAWLTVDEADNDPRVLSAYIALALHRVQAVHAGVLAALTESRREYLRNALLPELTMMAAEREPVVLVVDGVEALSDPRACEVLQAIATGLPAQCHLVLLGRAAPELDWLRLAEHTAVLDVGVDDLRLSRAEGLALLHGIGLELSEAEVDALLTRTEGWAAGTYLAALSIAADAEQRKVGDLVEGSDGLIAEYLGHELLAGMSAQEQDFLLRTSVLHELSGPLCDAVLLGTGSAAVLERLALANVLLSRVDRPDGDWYRLHPLFSEALRAALTRREASLVPELHRRASAWFEEHDAAELAIEHAIVAHEPALAARLVWDQVGWSLANGDVAKVEGWLDCFPARQTATYAKLALSAAWCALERGRPADHWIGLASHGRYDADRKAESTSVAAGTALLHAVVGRNGVVQMGADARLALDLDELDDAGRCMAELLVALSAYLGGHTEEARDGFERLRDEAHLCGAHEARVLALCELSLLASDEEAWDRARELSELAMNVVHQRDLEQLSLLAPVHSCAALVSAHFDDPADAALAVQQAHALLATAVEPPTWQGIQCRETLARAALSLGDSAGARTLLSEAQSLLNADDDESLRARVDETWRRVAGRPLDVTPGTTLTRAELRVLQLLPTHLSFAQIGQQLFVSRNTVKTQAVSAYRKLGVGSRSEAVEKAQALNLIAPAVAVQ